MKKVTKEICYRCWPIFNDECEHCLNLNEKKFTERDMIEAFRAGEWGCDMVKWFNAYYENKS